MTAYKRSQKYFILGIITIVISILNVILSFSVHSYSRSALWIFITILWALNVYFQRGPYILLDEKKITIDFGLRKKEYLLSDLELIEEKPNRLILIDKSSNQEKKVKLYLGYLNKEDIQSFISDFKDKLGS